MRYPFKSQYQNTVDRKKGNKYGTRATCKKEKETKKSCFQEISNSVQQIIKKNRKRYTERNAILGETGTEKTCEHNSRIDIREPGKQVAMHQKGKQAPTPRTKNTFAAWLSPLCYQVITL